MRRQSLHLELVPLTEATAVAHHLLRNGRPPRRLDHLDAARAQMALALGALSTIFLREGAALRPVSLSELRDLTSRAGSRRPQMSALCIRRGDLIAAIESIKSAGVAPS